MSPSRLSGLMVVFLMLFPVAANAQITVYDNFGAGHEGWDYDWGLGWTVAGEDVPAQFGVEQAMGFTSSSSGVVTDIWVAMWYVPSDPQEDEVTVRLARNPDGLPPTPQDVMEEWIITDFESWNQWNPPQHLAGSGTSALEAGESYWLWATGGETTWCGWCMNEDPTLTCPHTIRREGEDWLSISAETASAFRVDVASGQRLRLVTGPGANVVNPPLVRIFDPSETTTVLAEWSAYGVDQFGVNVACGDMNGNGMDAVITGAGPGAVFGPHVRGFGADGSPLGGVSFLAYGTNKFGVNVACGDIDNDGSDEIITGAGPGAVFGPHVRGWNVDGGSAATIPGISYFAYGTPKWGVNVACGDIDGDGFEEIVTGAGPGSVYGPHVRGWNVDGGGASAIPGVSFLAYGTNQFGVNVACGDMDGDGIDEIITGPGPGVVFGPHVRGWNYDGIDLAAMSGVSFFAYPGALLGAQVAGVDVDGDGMDEILTMPGPDSTQAALVRAWNVDGGTAQAITTIDFDAYGDMALMHGGKIAGGTF